MVIGWTGRGLNMKPIIYYFSGTGNSLIVARNIAERINGKLIPVAAVIEEECIKVDSDVVGIVYPVYHQGIPFIIKRFINSINEADKKYIFGVCTHGGGPGISLEYLDNILRTKGGKLDAGFAVKMPYNYITPSFAIKNFYSTFTLREIDIDKQQKMFRQWENKLESVCQIIESKKKCKLETNSEIIERLVDCLNLRETLQKKVWLKIAGYEGNTNLSFLESLQLMDCGFNWDDKCNSCGVCSDICPVSNIEMVDGRPVWQHRCEQCFACLQWCPKEAIQFSKRTAEGKRYHHPDVVLTDMLCK